MSKPKKYAHLTGAPKNLMDVGYCLAVAKGEIEPSEYALPKVWPEFAISAADIPDTKAAYGCGYGQGWEAEMSNRAFIPTPPVGLPIPLLPHFCEGVLAGSDNVKMARLASSHGASEIDFDPFSDIDQHDL
jgi:hypothetical protein